MIAILATMVLYGLGKAQAAARDAGRQQIITGIQSAMTRYYGDNGYYPPSNNAGANCCVCGTLLDLYNGRYISSSPIDPQTKTAICPGLTSGVNDKNPGIDANGALYWSSGEPTGPGAAYWHVGGPVIGGTCDSAEARGYQAQGYTFMLKKESGGASYFCSPQ